MKRQPLPLVAKTRSTRRQVGTPYGTSATGGVDCLGLVRIYFEQQQIIPKAAEAFLLTPGHEICQAQIKLISPGLGLKVTAIPLPSLPEVMAGDILLFSMVKDKAIPNISLMGIVQNLGRVLYISRNVGVVSAIWSGNWKERLRGIVRCLEV